MRIRAPAKINLSLRVVGRREDGYHLLDTIMLPVSLYDEIEIRKSKAKAKSAGARIKITCADPLVPRGEKISSMARLAIAAASRRTSKDSYSYSQAHSGRRRVGGGSTDAAATLVGLTDYLGSAIDAHLEKLALSLGADVPFFIRSRPARARGIGERLFRLAGMPRYGSLSSIPVFRFRPLGYTKISPES